MVLPSYPVDIPSNRRSQNLSAMSSSPRTSVTRSSPLTQAPLVFKDTSYMEQTFYDFTDHAVTCPKCYDPLATYHSGEQLCRRGNRYARYVASVVYDETHSAYGYSRNVSVTWQSVIRIPRGCEPVRQLLTALDHGLVIQPSSISTPSTPVTPKKFSYDFRTSFDRLELPSVGGYPLSPRLSQASDEEAYTRSRAVERAPKPSTRSQSSAPRRSKTVGIKERERRPYGSHPDTHSEGSNDSGYDTAPHSPDLRRGSQYAQDMARLQKDRPKPILKDTTAERSLPESPRSPRASRHSGVGFNIDGQYYAPGFN